MRENHVVIGGKEEKMREHRKGEQRCGVSLSSVGGFASHATPSFWIILLTDGNLQFYK